MVTCAVCGHEVVELGNYCSHCGASLAKVQGDTTRVIPLVPDEIVLPKQSDLLVGKDTVYEAALAWVRSELKP